MTKSKEELPKKKANIYVYTRRYGKTLMNSIMQIPLKWTQMFGILKHEKRGVRFATKNCFDSRCSF